MKRCPLTYMPITKESQAILIHLSGGDGTELTIETHHTGTLNYLEEEHRLIFNSIAILTERDEDQPDSIMTIDWANRPKPFLALSPMDLTLALIAEQIFGIPYYADGPMILISRTIDGDYYEQTMDEDEINRAFRALYDLRHKKEMIREEARIFILTSLINKATEMESCSKEQRDAMDYIKRFLDRTKGNDIAINLEELTDDLMMEKNRNLCHRLLDSLDEN